jgi:cytochrome c
MATGHVVFAGEPLLWFVMVKDTEGRFPGNPNWGEEWGWALFEPPDPVKNASTDYREDCLACHEPARSTDLVYVQGYPTLR